MAVTWIDIAGTYTGPGSYNYNVASYPSGAQLFVNSATGTDGRRSNIIGIASVGAQSLGSQGPYGDPVKPLKTVFGPAGALSQCVAGRGDTIIVAPGHVETLGTGAAISIPSGVTIVGGGYGNQRPTFQFTNASTFIQPAGTVQFNNLIFDLTQVATLAKGFNIVTNGVQFNLCKLIQASGTNQATVGIILNAGADDFLFGGSEIDGTAAAITSGIGISNPASNNINRCNIINSYIHGQFGTANISFQSTGSSEVVISNCILRQESAAVNFCLVVPTGTSFLLTMQYNSFYTISGAATLAGVVSGTTNTGSAFFQNFVVKGATPETPGVLF